MTAATDRPPLAAVALISAAALAYEVLLLRLLAIVQWHHFASLVISLALLGIGASGTLLALVRLRALDRYRTWFVASAWLFALSAPACFLLAQRVPFNPLALPWDPLQAGWLTVLYVSLVPPFLFAGLCIGASLARFAAAAGTVYAADLVGAAFGAGAVLLGLLIATEERALLVVGAAGAVAGLVAARRPGRVMRVVIGIAVIAAALAAPEPVLRVSPYKPLAQALEASGVMVLAEATGPLGRVTVLENRDAPYRVASGLSLLSTFAPPPRPLVFVDAGAPDVLADAGGPASENAHLDYEIGAAPYVLLDRPHVLVLGAGGGIEVLRALHHGADRAVAVEANARLVAVARSQAGARLSVYRDQRVVTAVATARGYLARSRESFDLVSIRVPAASAAGLDALEPAPLLTVEGLAAALGRLSPDGLLAVRLGLRVPPREGPRLFATLIDALAARGVTEPASHLVWLRGYDAQLVLATVARLRPDDVRALERFAVERAFDIVHAPAPSTAAPNRFNRLDGAWFAGAAARLLSDRERFVDGYKFDLRAPGDDRPYFHDGFRWRWLPELAALRRQGGAGLVELGVPVLAMALIQALTIGLALIAAPLALLPRASAGEAGQASAPRTFAFFLAIGLGFLLIEIASLQRLVLFLGHPATAGAAAIAGFLVFAGLGSIASTGLAARFGAATTVRLAVATITLATVVMSALLETLAERLLGAPFPLLVIVAFAGIACMATPMGMLLPIALAALERESPRLVPWAWAVNGCASVTGAVGAALIALHVGLNAVLAGGIACYVLAAATAPGTHRRG